MRASVPSSKDVFDAIVVGSGATGGWAAKELTEAGLRVCLVEAGRNLDPAKEFNEHMAPYETRYRTFSPEIERTRFLQKKCYACTEYNYKWFVNDLKNPFTTAPGKSFEWYRLRILGGRSLAWGRQSYRLSDLDFKCKSHEGFGEDWPLSYADMAPYYDKVEDFVGISGQAEGLPQLPDSKFLPPMNMTCGEVMLRKAVKKKLGWTVTIGRTAVLTKPHNGRAPCHYCGPCERGCRTRSYFNSPTTTIEAARDTGRLTLLTDAVVYKVLMDSDSGKATGVAYIDRVTRVPRQVRGKVVVLCAQALESTRVLFNSATRQHPNGLGNSSGVMGHYLMDHIMGGSASGRMPMLNPEPWIGPPRRPNGIYVARFRNIDKKNPHPKFIRGYGFQGGSSGGFDYSARGLGKEFKEVVREGSYGIRLGGFGECLPQWENSCELDKNVVDAWGIPVLKLNCAYGDNERHMLEDMAEAAGEMLEAAGTKNIRTHKRMSTFGQTIHEVGTARMGNDPKTSVLNKWCQAHDVKNLFLTDGASFVSCGNQNPTLTMMALTVRACDYLVEQFRKNEL